MLSNVVIQEDPAGNIKCAKNKSKEKIDGIIAMIMSLGEYMTESDVSSIYDERDILVL
jgi:phage terminase large subunit-like protein